MHFEKPGPHVVPRRVWPVAQHSTLSFIFGTNEGRQIMRREERVTVRETHVLRKEVTPGKVRAADFIVIGFDRGVLCGPEHGLDFGMSGQLEQVIVMPRVAAQRLTVALQQLDFAVDCEHLLDKCSPKMQKAQNERCFIFGAE